MGKSPKCPHCKARFYSIYAAAMHREWTANKQCMTREQMEKAGMVLYLGAWLTSALPQQEPVATQEAQ